MYKNKIINKTMDLEDLKSEEAEAIIENLNNLIKQLREKGLKTSSWYGKLDLAEDANSYEWINRGYDYNSLKTAADDKNFPWFLYWEIVWVAINNEFSRHHKILDLGGSSSLFSYYLASKGFNVKTADLQKKLVDNANFVAKKMNWNLSNYVMGMRDLK